MTKRRGPIGAEYTSPGPIYPLPSLMGRQNHDPRSSFKRAPAWALGDRYGKLRDDSGPGPAYKVDSNLLRTGHATSFAFSLHSRPNYLENDFTPDPGRYNYESAASRIYKSSPAYSFGLKRSGKTTDITPGPNVYLLDPMLSKTFRSEKPSAPSYSLLSRNKIGGFSEDLTKTPGPGAYSVPDFSTYKRKLPAITISSRNPLPGDNSVKPGPGSYYPPNRDNGPAYSFGSYHSQYRGHLIVNDDVED